MNATDTVKREYAWYPGGVDRLLAMRTPTDTLAALLDPVTGTVRGLARFRNGARVKEYDEAPWGDAVADTGLVVRYRFAGREWDPESGLYYMRARYYDPQLGRWVSEDPIGLGGGDGNLFQYAGGDPVNGTDPSGLGPYGMQLIPCSVHYQPGYCGYGSHGGTLAGDFFFRPDYGAQGDGDPFIGGDLPPGATPAKNGSAAAPGGERDENGVGNREKRLRPDCNALFRDFAVSGAINLALGGAGAYARHLATNAFVLTHRWRLLYRQGRQLSSLYFREDARAVSHSASRLQGLVVTGLALNRFGAAAAAPDDGEFDIKDFLRLVPGGDTGVAFWDWGSACVWD